MRLLLIRHGASHHSQHGHIAGVRACAGLTEEGLRQALALAGRLQSDGILEEHPLLLSSPVLRARQTAEVLAETLGLPLEPADCDLCELHPGAADGLSWPEYERRYGSFDLLAEQERPFAPGGESWRAFLERTERTLAGLAELHQGRTVLAVTHAGFIVAAFLTLFAIPRPGTGAHIDPAHASITEWRQQHGIWQLVRLNA